MKPLRIATTLILGLALIASGCGNGGAGTPPANGEVNAGPTAVAGLEEPIAHGPSFLTSVGQSADVQMVKTLLDRADMKHEFAPVGRVEELTDQYKTLILVIGGSSKGLGAAGIQPEEEMSRVAALVDKAQELGLVIISLHVGGEARRGELSDPFIANMAPASNYLIVVDEGNEDGLFTQIAVDNGIPMDIVTSIAGAQEPLEAAFVK